METAVLPLGTIFFTIFLSLVLGLIVAWSYSNFSNTVFYSRTFNFSLTFLPMIVAVIILSVKSSIAVSLGIIGALSIIRYRTPIKEPLDLLFIFWAVAVGISCGANFFFLAALFSVTLALCLGLSERMVFRKLLEPRCYVIIFRFSNNLAHDSFLQNMKKQLKPLTRSFREKHFMEDKDKKYVEIAIEVVCRKGKEDEVLKAARSLGAEETLVVSPEGAMISY